MSLSSSSEIQKKLGGNLTAATCNANYGTKPTTPIFSSNNCFVSSKENKTYGCGDTELGLDGHKKARICYCVKGNLKIALRPAMAVGWEILYIYNFNLV